MDRYSSVQVIRTETLTFLGVSTEIYEATTKAVVQGRTPSTYSAQKLKIVQCGYLIL